MASNAENVSIWWRHHDQYICNQLNVRCLPLVNWDCWMITVGPDNYVVTIYVYIIAMEFYGCGESEVSCAKYFFQQLNHQCRDQSARLMQRVNNISFIPSNWHRYFIRHCDNSRKCIRFYNHRKHPIHRSHGRAMVCLFWWFGERNDRVITAPHCMSHSDSIGILLYEVIHFLCIAPNRPASSKLWSMRHHSPLLHCVRWSVFWNTTFLLKIYNNWYCKNYSCHEPIKCSCWY